MRGRATIKGTLLQCIRCQYLALNRQVTSEMETKYSTGIIRELSVGEVRLAKGGVAQ